MSLPLRKHECTHPNPIEKKTQMFLETSFCQIILFTAGTRTPSSLSEGFQRSPPNSAAKNGVQRLAKSQMIWRGPQQSNDNTKNLVVKGPTPRTTVPEAAGSVGLGIWEFEKSKIDGFRSSVTTETLE